MLNNFSREIGVCEKMREIILQKGKPCWQYVTIWYILILWCKFKAKCKHSEYVI